MKIKIGLVSLNFSPGHYSHLIAYNKALRSLNYEPTLILDTGYKNLVSQNDKLNNIKFLHFKRREFEDFLLYDLIIIFNPSTKNHILSKFLIRNKKKVLYLYHEPYDSVKNYLKEGFLSAIKMLVAHYFSKKILKTSDLIILPSNYAKILYGKKDITYNKNYMIIPLLFDDENNDKNFLNEITKKQYFSYIGTATVSRGFDKFLDFIKFLDNEGVKYKFQIATRVNISNYLKNDEHLTTMIKNNKLEITHNKVLTNSEINQAYEKSFCVWNFYRRSTQSGVLPKSFMFGSPVIAAKIASFPEFVKNGINGYLLEKFDYHDVANKLDYIYENKYSFSKNARESFLKNFYWKSNLDVLEKTLKKIIKV